MSPFFLEANMLSASVVARHPSGQPILPPEFGVAPGNLLLFTDLSEEQVKALDDFIENDDVLPPAWEEEDVVELCWRLLKDLEKLDDPETPIIDKIVSLNWIFAEAKLARRPFSFVFCVKVTSLSPLSRLPYIGDFDPDDFLDLISHKIKRWMRDTVSRYPEWVRDLILTNPGYVVDRLEKKPQWLNDQIRSIENSPTGQLFSV